jgi:PIN domain nuclease of toxin-antitoxin system
MEFATTSEHALLAGTLPGEHRDPFDRMLAAQALIEGVPVVSKDLALEGLRVPIIW